MTKRESKLEDTDWTDSGIAKIRRSYPSPTNIQDILLPPHRKRKKKQHKNELLSTIDQVMTKCVHRPFTKGALHSSV